MTGNRLFIGLAWLLAAASAVCGEQRPPNIIYILADDLGYGELGAYGQEKIRTPNLDRLAAEGMRFTQHYSAAPVCAPARCSLLTGRHGGRASVRDKRGVPPEGQWPIPAEEVTVARLLKERGYATGAFGKWGLGFVGSSGDPNHHGFDVFYGYNCQSMAHTHYPAHLWRNDERIDLSDLNPSHRGHLRQVRDFRYTPDQDEYFDAFKGGAYSADLILEAALEFIGEHKDRPFFVYYPSLIPHVALQVPDELVEPYLELGWEDEPYLAQPGPYAPHRHPKAAYAAMITRLDAEVGRIMELLKQLELDDDTIVLFSSDNGPTFLDQVDTAFFNSAGGLRGLKGSVYEGGIRVPMIARWPGRVAPGSVTKLPSYFPDVLPTLLELAGSPDAVPDDVDGLSFAPTLLGQPDRQQRHEFMVWEFHGYQGQQAVRMGDWKGVRRNIHRGRLEIELYDLAADPAESQDVASEHPAIVRRIERIMAEERTVSKDFPFAALGDE